jgi:hypothetical protein
LVRVRAPDTLFAAVTPRKQQNVTKMMANWTRGIALAALVVLAWAVLVPGGLFWTAMLALGVLGAAFTMAMLMRSRRLPTMSQMIASVRAEPATAPARSHPGEAGLQPREGR